MNCPLETPETANLLLEYCARKLNAESTATIERHVEVCPACRQFADGQRAVWSALDSWDAGPVSADFDSRLYQRIEESNATWRDRLRAALRPLSAHRGMLAAGAACVVLLVGVLLQRPGASVPVPTSPEAVVDVQAEQLEKALDAMDVLSEFNRKARPEKPESKL